MSTGSLGGYPMSRDASGTSWQPDVSDHGGLHLMAGEWMLMGHALVNGVYDWQEGPRGGEKAFASGMVMGMARREVGDGDVLGFRAMLSPDPFMGKRGYPLLLAAGETADGVTPLVDRQHPHDFFMELSGSYSHRFIDRDSAFVYFGLPGEPAFGPPAFMHRLSAMDSPEAPITHHWLDSTHITFGVLTAGWVHDRFKLEVSGFRGREPDQHRYDIESPELDSIAVRASWNPGEYLALQASWADLESPEQLEPGDDEERWSLSGVYTRPIARGSWWSLTLAGARKDRSGAKALDAALLELAVRATPRWTVFARGEALETDELGPTPGVPIEDVGKISLGAIHDFTPHENVRLGLGLVYAHDFVPRSLEGSYGGDPQAVLAFVRVVVE
ncbi:MAG TPA: hypothetical protein VFT98_05115 [Myxococcota bacterium]|nr:hypothetical protein [Myxococcota bacterium]